jgi:hypothetical protein
LDKRVTTVTLEGYQLEYLQEKGIELSVFLRNCIDAKIQNGKSQIEQLENEKAEALKQIDHYQIIVNQIDMQIAELRKEQEKEIEEGKALNEFEDKRRAYIVTCIQKLQREKTCTPLWLGHLREAWKFDTNEDAKKYVREVWREEGVPENRIIKFLCLN